MTHLAAMAAAYPDRPAVVLEPSGVVLSYAELDARSSRVAHVLRARGLGPGACVAILLENRAEFLEVAWGAQRAGLYYVGVNRHLMPDEVAYILDDSDADAVVASTDLAALAEGARVGTRLVVGGHGRDGWEDYEQALAAAPGGPIPDEGEGDFLLYTSGTTGRPKGVRRELTNAPMGDYVDLPGRWLRELLGLAPGDVYLCPAPLYHAAPLGWSMGVLRTGATVVVLERFDPELALAVIERRRVTHSQWVPTMFVRMLKLPDEARGRYDLSSHRHAVHSAAPCPVEVKRDMIAWWGPILFEFYSSTEGMGATSITSAEWLDRPGSVGRPMLGTPYVTDDEGRELPAGEVGTVWFTGGRDFDYRGDPGKSAASRDSRGGASVGDLGHLDVEGYLFLSDRRPNLIITGGVNVYPREVEDALVVHPAVLDVGVVGLPDPEMGERVVATVLPAEGTETGDDLAAELTTHLRSRLAGFKVPREIRFTTDLPRTPTGKMRTHELRARLQAQLS